LLHSDQVDTAVSLTGPESLSQRRRVELLAEATGRPIELVELTPDQARRHMGNFLPTDAVDLVLGVLAKAPHTATTTPPPPAMLGRKPHTYLEWAIAHRSAFTATIRQARS
jgi:uncharacterized protein YbjT (DUF2867 family)